MGSGPAEEGLTPLDVRLLRRLAVEPNVARASRALGIGRDRAVYRLARLRRLYGRPVVTAQRGGSTPGGSRLTPLGRSLLAKGSGERPGTNRLEGIYRRRPSPRVTFADGACLEVAFRAADGAPVRVEVDPEAIVVAVEKVDLSARNRLDVVVERVRERPDGTARITARWGDHRLRVALTAGSVRRLGLAPGRPAYLYAKAVAVRRASRSSPGPLRR